MTRAKTRLVGPLALLAGAACLWAPSAAGQTCESQRPTDAQGAQGVSYGNADTAFFDSDSGRARVHYALGGVHAPPALSTMQDGVPDAAVVAARAADDALDQYAQLGYEVPLSDVDSPCPSNGDSDAIDIYLVNFSAADGQALHDHCESGAPKRCAGFVLVENDFKQGGYADTAEGLRTVVPHELFHLVQDAYDADVERWWAEGSAQWAAKQVYPELRDLERFLPDYFDAPWRPLNVPPNGPITNFLYATAIWPVFLSERFDAALVREVYEGFALDTSSVLATTDLVLQARGSSLTQEFLEFAAFNAATAERAPEQAGYAHAADYPLVPVQALAIRDSTAELVSDVASGLGAYYYSITADAPLELSLDADATRMAGLLLPLEQGKAQLADAQPLPATLTGEGIVVVAGQSLARTDAPFALQGKVPKAAQRDDTPASSGCSFARIPGQNAGPGGAWLGIVVIFWGRCRARTRRRKGRC